MMMFDTGQVDPNTVASDSFMMNLQIILLHFVEPFMDANFTKARNLFRLSCIATDISVDGSHQPSVSCAFYAH